MEQKQFELLIEELKKDFNGSIDYHSGVNDGMYHLMRYLLQERVIDKLAINSANFAEWVSNSDWTYIPSNGKWYNEEDEENITPLSTSELINMFLNEKNNDDKRK